MGTGSRVVIKHLYTVLQCELIPESLKNLLLVMETAQVFSSSQHFHCAPSLVSQLVASAPASASTDGASAQLQQPSDGASATRSTAPAPTSAAAAPPQPQPQEGTLNGEQLWALSVERVRAFLPELYADLMQMRAPAPPPTVAAPPPAAPSAPASEESAVSSAASASAAPPDASVAHAQPPIQLSEAPTNMVDIVLYTV